MEPDASVAPARLNRPIITRPPQTTWMSAAHQLGQARNSTARPVPRLPPKTPNIEAVPWTRNMNPITMRNSDSTGPENRSRKIIASPLHKEGVGAGMNLFRHVFSSAGMQAPPGAMPSGPTVSPPGTAGSLSAAGSGMLKKVR